MNLRLKLALFSTIQILLLAVLFPVAAQDTSVGSSLSSAPYKTGERLTYNVGFSNILSAAHVEVEVVSRGAFFGRDAIQLRAHVETTGVVNVALVAINSDYVTFVDPDTGLPFRVRETVRDAPNSGDEARDFNQGGVPLVSGKQKGLPGTYDILSAVYRARSLPLTEGSSYTFLVRTGNQNYTAELRVTGREPVRTNVGSFDTFVTQVKISNDPAVKSLKIYFSDDARHVPVLITGRVSTGDLRAELAASEFVVPAPTVTPTPAPAPTIATVIPSPSPRPVPPGISGDLPFKVGEQLNYQIFLSNAATPVGTANFQVRARSRFFEREGILVGVRAQTTGAASRLFVANDQINSYMDPAGLLPYRAEYSLAEGSRRLNQILTFNQDYGTATSDAGAKIEIPVGTYDYLSFFYAMRTFNLTPPKRNAISILVENKPKTLFISSVKRETIQLGDQKIPAISLALTTDDAESDKYQLRIWVSDDKRRLPLRISCVTQLGPVRADLVILPTTIQ